MQEVAAISESRKFPASHVVQFFALAPENVPGEQASLQVDWPSKALKYPGRQRSQLVLPSTAEYLPAIHLVQFVAPISEYFPALHMMQAESDALRKYPGSQK